MHGQGRRLRILGIDPGLTGALALYDPVAPCAVIVEGMSAVDGEIESAGLVRLIRQLAPINAFIEHVSAMPRNGVVQAFRLGSAFTAARVALAFRAMTHRLIRPLAWKRAMRLEGGPSGKEQARARALPLLAAAAEHFARKKDHGRAEAALLAFYASQHA